MRSFPLFFVASALVLAVGCDTAYAPAEIPDPPATLTPAPIDAIDTSGVSLPTDLTCVSAPLGDTTDVLRVQIVADANGSTVSLQAGPQFRSHNGVWATDERPVEVRNVEVADGRLVEADRWGLDIALTREGDVLRGTLVDEACYVRLETTLTCWNELDLFGSPWSGVPGTLDARFDWESGACLDADGNEALNHLPIEVIRETGHGECADLRGVALNGADYTGPDLSGWNLAGARLDGASLFFAQLRDATLVGAKLSDLAFGYASITGYINDDTELPAACEKVSNPWSGQTASCVQ